MFKVHENVGLLNVLADSGYLLASNKCWVNKRWCYSPAWVIWIYRTDISPGPINQRLVLTITNRPYAKTDKWWCWGLKSFLLPWPCLPMLIVSTVALFHMAPIYMLLLLMNYLGINVREVFLPLMIWFPVLAGNLIMKQQNQVMITSNFICCTLAFCCAWTSYSVSNVTREILHSKPC